MGNYIFRRDGKIYMCCDCLEATDCTDCHRWGTHIKRELYRKYDAEVERLFEIEKENRKKQVKENYENRG